MEQAGQKKKTALDEEIKRIKLIQKVMNSENKNTIKLEEAAKGLINVDLEKLVPQDNIISDIPPDIANKPIQLEELENALELFNKNKQSDVDNKQKDKQLKKEEPSEKNIKIDDNLKFHIVYVTPANSPKFSPVLTGTPSKTASRVVYTSTPEEWKTGDTPFNPDKENNHSECIRITSGYYIGYFNHSMYGIHLKGHPEAKSMWGKNWGGAWGEGNDKAVKGSNRRVLFVIDISNSLKEYDPVGSDRRCFRSRSLKQTIIKNNENVDYGLLFFHEKKRKFVDFISYKEGSKVLYDSLNNFACRAEGGTNMLQAYKEAMDILKEVRPFDTIVLLTDQDEQTKELEELREKHKGVKVLTNREELFHVLDHIVRL